MNSLRFTLLLILAFLRRFRLPITLLIVIFVASFLIAKIVLPRMGKTDTYYIGYVGRYHTDELPVEVLGKLTSGLTKLSTDGTPEPDIAKSWRSEENGKTWIFEIDTSKKWHDGTPVTSHSIQYTFEDVSIERPDEKTLIFKLESAYAPFPVVVSRPTFKRGLIGTGTWKAHKISVSGSFVEKLTLKDNFGNTHVIHFYPNEDSAKTAFKLGHIDELELTDPSPFKEWNTVSVTSALEPLRYVGLFFNMQNDLFKDNKPLRQALSYAIDKSRWGDTNRVLSPVPKTSWAYNPQVKPYDYDPKRAQELLAPIPKAERDQMEFKILSVPQLLTTAEDIARDWRELGFKVEVQVATTMPSDYQVFLAMYDVTLDPDQYLTWHSTQKETNISHYANPRIDKLLEDGRLELNIDTRKRLYVDFQRFLLEDVPAVFLYTPSSFTVKRK